MSFTKHIKHLSQHLLGLMLCFALLSGVLSDGIHELIAHAFETTKACSEEAEKDACHRFTYHHEKSKDCDGSHEHLSLKDEDCFACKYFIEKDQNYLIKKQSLVFDPPSSLIPYSEKNSFFFSCQNSSFLRGPPIFNS